MNRPRRRQGPLARCLSQMRRDLWLQGVAILSLTVSLSIVGSYFGFCLNLHKVFSRLSTGASLTAVLHPGTQPDQLREMLRKLSGNVEVEGVVYIAKEQALKNFAKELGPHRGLLQGLEGNPLPDTLEIRLRPGSPGTELADTLKDFPAVEEVISGRPWLHRLEKARLVLYELGAALGLLLVLGVVLLVANTVRLAVYVRRDQLEVMELVGASLGYVRRPFLLEAVIQGLLGAGLASLLIWVILGVLGAPSALPLGLNLQQLFDFSWQIPLYLAGVALIAGLAGGAWGVGRALRAKGI